MDLFDHSALTLPAGAVLAIVMGVWLRGSAFAMARRRRRAPG